MRVAHRFSRHIVIALAFGIFAFLTLTFSTSMSPAKPSKQLLVCIKLKDKNEAINKAVSGLKDKEVVELEHGKTHPAVNVDASFDYVIRMTFRTAQDLSVYRSGKTFSEFEKNGKANWEESMILSTDIN